MIRWIILLQAVIYLLAMPTLRAAGELGYHPPIIVGLIAVVAFTFGAFFRSHAGPTSTPPLDKDLVPRPQLWLFMLMLSVIYDLTSLRFGLLDRRQGSEVMAEIYGTMPLWALAVIRIYELVFIPTIIIYLVAQPVRKFDRIAITIGVLASLPFMGISDSRGRVVIIAMTVVAFFPLGRVLRYATLNAKALLAVSLVLASFAYSSANRSDQYFSTEDYLQVEVYQRLDGLNIITQLRAAHLISYWGSWDDNLASPLISKIPFLKVAQRAKIEGLTSSKQYYLQSLLKSQKIDDSNSIITDPLYFSGIFGLVVAFILLGRFSMHFDRYILNQPFSRSRLRIALALSFCASFISFEADFLGAIASTLQTWIIVYVFLMIGCRYKEYYTGDTSKDLWLAREPAANALN